MSLAGVAVGDGNSGGQVRRGKRENLDKVPDGRTGASQTLRLLKIQGLRDRYDVTY
jgi:hypothetical protein